MNLYMEKQNRSNVIRVLTVALGNVPLESIKRRSTPLNPIIGTNVIFALIAAMIASILRYTGECTPVKSPSNANSATIEVATKLE